MKNWQSVSVMAICLCSLIAVFIAPLSAQPLSGAGQGTVVPPVSAASVTDTLHQRTLAYYQAIERGDRAAARKYVNPESNEEFERVDLHSITKVEVKDISVAPTGDSAVVNVVRIYTPPYEISMPWKDKWTLVNGEWLLTIPAPDGENPFGIKPVRATDDEKAMQEQIERQTMIVNDPDQINRTIMKIEGEEKKKQQEKEKAAEAAKTQQAAAQQTSGKSKSKKSPKKNADVKQNSLTPATPSTPQ